MNLNVALLGFGNVGRALAALLSEKADVLRSEHGLTVRVVGISTGRHGQAIDPTGIHLRTALDAVRHGSGVAGLSGGGYGSSPGDTAGFVADVPADLVFETIPTNPRDGEPALSFARMLLGRGVHVVTANKGPVAFGYRELSALAAANDAGFFFESTVMDGAPVHGAAREGLPAATVNRIRGIFNSTTNYILTRMEQEDLSFEEALAAAQQIGIAETDPTLDIDGWDSAIKTVILANVAMGGDLRPADVAREGIRGMALEDVQAARETGKRIRLICEVVRSPLGAVSARVYPEAVPAGDVYASITGTTSIVDFETDTLPRLTLIEHDPGPHTTAYGMLVDMVNIARGRHRGLPPA